MPKLHVMFATSAAVFSQLGLAFAQDTSMQGHNMAAMELPTACQTGEAPAMPGMENMESMMQGMDEDQKAFMQGMMQTHDPMMKGMMAEDTDVAFACAMIPHHQGAINMAEVELQYGDSDEMKEMARKIIDAQKQEIAELTQFIEGQAQ
ncbi:MAG: DUF305 domain-containing protein [Pseudomonadota bacterium]|nr:DUF305 domain-containing protein [Pseudomonadota bacterium]